LKNSLIMKKAGIQPAFLLSVANQASPQHRFMAVSSRTAVPVPAGNAFAADKPLWALGIGIAWVLAEASTRVAVVR